MVDCEERDAGLIRASAYPNVHRDKYMHRDILKTLLLITSSCTNATISVCILSVTGEKDFAADQSDPNNPVHAN
jgi:hypothetical protein